jgi:hypothetical protein
MNRKWLATDLGWRDYPEHSQSCRDVREIFSSGTEWGLALSGETFCPSTDILSVVMFWWYRKYAPVDTVLEGLGGRSTRNQERLVG